MCITFPLQRYAAALWAAMTAVAVGLVLSTQAGAQAMAPSPSQAARTVELAMFEQPGCVYCLRWHEDVGPEYPVTAEGRAAPLRVLQLHAPLPDGISIARPVLFTPTFVLLINGQEAGRLEGYPGEDFFWGLLQSLLADAAIAVE
jgi:hypothetical protein